MYSKHNICVENHSNKDCLCKLRGPQGLPGEQGPRGPNGESSEGNIISFGANFYILESKFGPFYLVPWNRLQSILGDLDGDIILSQTLPFRSDPGPYVAKNTIVTISNDEVYPVTGGTITFTLGTVISSNGVTSFVASPISINVPYNIFLTVGQHQFNLAPGIIATFAQGDTIAVQMRMNIIGIPANFVLHFVTFDFLLSSSP